MFINLYIARPTFRFILIYTCGLTAVIKRICYVMFFDPHNLLSHLNPDWFYLSGTGLPRLSWKRGRRSSTSSFTTAKFHSASRVSRHSGHLAAMLLLVKCCMTKYCRYLL